MSNLTGATYPGRFIEPLRDALKELEQQLEYEKANPFGTALFDWEIREAIKKAKAKLAAAEEMEVYRLRCEAKANP